MQALPHPRRALRAPGHHQAELCSHLHWAPVLIPLLAIREEQLAASRARLAEVGVEERRRLVRAIEEELERRAEKDRSAQKQKE